MQEVIIYSSMVSRETVCIALTMAMLHNQKVKAADVLNTYRTVSNREKIWAVLSPQFECDYCKFARCII